MFIMMYPLDVVLTHFWTLWTTLLDYEFRRSTAQYSSKWIFRELPEHTRREEEARARIDPSRSFNAVS